MRKLIFSFFILVSFFSLQSCEKDVSKIDFHVEYFGLSKGKFIEYEVTEIKHDINAAIQHDTTKYFLKTVVGDTIKDNSGRLCYTFLRYTRANNLLNWELKDIWTAITIDNRAELIEENQRIVKLVFSPQVGKSWNPNSFNAFAAEEWYYADVHQSKFLNNANFDSTLTVEQDDFFSMIDRKKKHEVYAKGVGLVHKYYKDLKIIGFDTMNVQSGSEIYYAYLNHGVE
jgi:hypothetical protein